MRIPSPDEIVDIVDNNDNVVNQCSKIEAHEKGLLHRTILAEVINPEGKWILVRQAKDRQDAGQFVSPVGGHIRAGESEVVALKREAKEEMGISDFTYKYIGKAIFDRQVLSRHENHLFILYEIHTDQKPILNHESISFRRFTSQDLKKEMKANPRSFGDAWWFVVKEFYPQFLSN